jgi:hypothetical protein
MTNEHLTDITTKQLVRPCVLAVDGTAYSAAIDKLALKQELVSARDLSRRTRTGVTVRRWRGYVLVDGIPVAAPHYGRPKGLKVEKGRAS